DPGFPLERWPREDAKMTSDIPGRRCLVEVAALPTFTSPFRWRLVARLSNAYELREIDLLDPRFRDAVDTLWRVTVRPNVWTAPVMIAAETPIGQTFLGFARFPVARSIEDRSGATTVRFNDIRFAAGIVSLSQSSPRLDPFGVLIQLDPNGRV